MQGEQAQEGHVVGCFIPAEWFRFEQNLSCRLLLVSLYQIPVKIHGVPSKLFVDLCFKLKLFPRGVLSRSVLSERTVFKLSHVENGFDFEEDADLLFALSLVVPNKLLVGQLAVFFNRSYHPDFARGGRQVQN